MVENISAGDKESIQTSRTRNCSHNRPKLRKVLANGHGDSMERWGQVEVMAKEGGGKQESISADLMVDKRTCVILDSSISGKPLGQIHACCPFLCSMGNRLTHLRDDH